MGFHVFAAYYCCRERAKQIKVLNQVGVTASQSRNVKVLRASRMSCRSDADCSSESYTTLDAVSSTRLPQRSSRRSSYWRLGWGD